MFLLSTLRPALFSTVLLVVLTPGVLAADTLSQLETAARQRPKDSNAHAALGAELYRLGKVKESLEEEKRAIQLDSKNIKAHQQLGLAFLYLGMTQEAREEMRNVVSLKGAKKCRCGSLDAALRKALKKYADEYQSKGANGKDSHS